jgi:hypothetical protein
LSFEVWDNDVYFYQRIARALNEGEWWHAFNHYVPILFGWIWGVLGISSSLVIVVFQAFLSTLLFIPLLKLSKQMDVGTKPWIVLLFVGFQASMMRYGMQPLPDTLFLLIHLFILSELSGEKIRGWLLVGAVFLLSWTRYDAFLFYGIYFVWAFLMSGEKRRNFKLLGIGILLSLSSLSLTSYLRYESFLPTNRFCSLYSEVGEDQLVNGQTLWHTLAVQGKLARQHSEETIQQALIEKNRRESVNASSVRGLLGNFLGLAVWPGALWRSEQCGVLVLLLMLWGLWKAPVKIRWLALLALVSVGIYSFLGVKERYLIFATPLILMIAARGVSRITYRPLFVLLLLIWLGVQLKHGSYHYRHPEVQLGEHRLAGEWVRNHGHKKGPVIGREGMSAIYAGREWRRLPTSDSVKEILDYARAEGASYLVMADRNFLSKRKWQADLFELCQKKAVHVATFKGYKAYVMEIAGD